MMTEKNRSDNPIVVSISCITYNHAPYIRQCLDGFMMQQTDFPFEVLIHDDASTDGTTEIIKEYEAKYPDVIKPIYEDENQWVKGRRGSTLFNFPRAKGKYIALCEGDDYWTDPLKLQKQVDFLEANSDYSMCFHAARINNELDCSIWLKSNELDAREYVASELFSEWLVPTASMLYRKEVNDISIANEDDVLNVDLILVLKCCRYGKVMALRDEMSVYRMHSGGVTYSEQFAKERALKYPAHYKCIKYNFGDIIEKTLVNRKISEAYWNLREVNDNWLLGQIYKFKALCYEPLYILNKYCHNE